MNRTAAFVVSLLIALPADAQTEAPPSAAPAGATRFDSGAAWIAVKPATGTVSPAVGDYVRLEYTGWDESGSIIDSTAKHPDINIFAFEKLAAGMKETIAQMRVGEKRRVWLPAAMSPTRTPAVFDLELVDIARPLDAPADVAAPPADAQRSASGLAWKVLKRGTGTEQPKKNSFVVVRYSGWNTSGALFDSTYLRGDTSGFKLDAVIPGWREGLQLMTAGEVRRFWIPERLAYKGQRKMPQGMLVFDIELVRFR